MSLQSNIRVSYIRIKIRIKVWIKVGFRVRVHLWLALSNSPMAVSRLSNALEGRQSCHGERVRRVKAY